MQYLTKLKDFFGGEKSTIAKIEDINIDTLGEIITANACFCIKNVGETMQKSIKDGNSLKSTFDHEAGVDLISAARAHIVRYGYFSLKGNIPTINCLAS